MTAKIWNYSGWINNSDLSNIKKGFKGVFKDINENVASTTEAELAGADVLCYITERMNITVTTCPADGCAFINIITGNDGRLYDLLSVMPDYFDILINDSDNGIYPGQKTSFMQQAEEMEQKDVDTEKSKEQKAKTSDSLKH